METLPSEGGASKREGWRPKSDKRKLRKQKKQKKDEGGRKGKGRRNTETMPGEDLKKRASTEMREWEEQ